MTDNFAFLESALYARRVVTHSDSSLSVSVSQLTRQWLEAIGEDPTREGLQRTPERVEAAWQFLTQGQRQTLTEVVGEGVFPAEGSELVIVKDIEFYSLCEHHMLPFYGRAHIAYLPDAQILGLSKFARIVELYSRRLQVQERITVQVADAFEELLQPKGVAVLLEGVHLCMAMRGVQTQHSSTVTTAMRGEFTQNAALRSEFMNAVQQGFRGR